MLLALRAVSKEVRAAFENPLGNHVWFYPPVKELMVAWGRASTVAPRCADSAAPHRRPYKKAIKFLATGTWIQ